MESAGSNMPGLSKKDNLVKDIEYFQWVCHDTESVCRPFYTGHVLLDLSAFLLLCMPLMKSFAIYAIVPYIFCNICTKFVQAFKNIYKYLLLRLIFDF